MGDSLPPYWGAPARGSSEDCAVAPPQEKAVAEGEYPPIGEGEFKLLAGEMNGAGCHAPTCKASVPPVVAVYGADTVFGAFEVSGLSSAPVVTNLGRGWLQNWSPSVWSWDIWCCGAAEIGAIGRIMVGSLCPSG